MTDDVVVTRRPDPPEGTATPASGRQVSVVVMPSYLRDASMRHQQATAAAAGLPLGTVRELTDRGVPVLLGSGRHPGQAARIADMIRARFDVEVEVLAPGKGWVWAVTALVSGMIGAPMLIAALTLASAQVAILIVALTAAAAGVSIMLANREREQEALRVAALDAYDAAMDDLDAHRDALDALTRVREASLSDDLPAQAAADLWHALDEVEGNLDGALDVREALAMLQDTADQLLADPTDDALARLRRAAGAAQATRRELGPPTT